MSCSYVGQVGGLLRVCVQGPLSHYPSMTVEEIDFLGGSYKQQIFIEMRMFKGIHWALIYITTNKYCNH